jgi:predicted aspartyl protease
VKVTRFDSRRDIIVVRAVVRGPRGDMPLKVVVDTGCGLTMIDPSVIDRIGYSARDGESFTKVRSVVHEEHGYTLRVPRFRALGHEVNDLLVTVNDLPEGWGIDGLLGWDFLRQFNFEIRSGEGRIIAERAL